MQRISIIKRSASIAGFVVTVLLAADPVSAESAVARGKLLVETNCAPCHAVGLHGASPHPDAPAFRTLSRRYPLTYLEEALAEGISTGHPDMPEFIVNPNQITAIISYLQSLQGR